MKPLYDITKSFEYNIAHGPFFDGSIAQRIFPDQSQWHDFLGYKIASRIGVGPCPVTLSNGIKLLAQLGFDVITYKTIRSKKAEPHSFPHISFVQSFSYSSNKTYYASTVADTSLSIANSIGNASFDPEWTFHDIQKARSFICSGQVLIVSVFGAGESEAAIIEEFVQAAQLARQAGAQVIELNLSCPNLKEKGALFSNHLLVHKISQAVYTAVSIPIIAKIGCIESQEVLSQLLSVCARAGVRGVSAINAIPVAVSDRNGRPYFGKLRERAGLSGNSIRALALEMITQISRINKKEKLNLEVIGLGGVTSSEHIDQFLLAGASVAQSVTGAMWHPYLANEYHKRAYNFEQKEQNEQRSISTKTS